MDADPSLGCRLWLPSAACICSYLMLASEKMEPRAPMSLPKSVSAVSTLLPDEPTVGRALGSPALHTIVSIGPTPEGAGQGEVRTCPHRAAGRVGCLMRPAAGGKRRTRHRGQNWGLQSAKHIHRAPPRAYAHTRLRWAGPLHTRGAEPDGAHWSAPSAQGGGRVRRSTCLSRPPTGSSCPWVPARRRRSAWRRRGRRRASRRWRADA